MGKLSPSVYLPKGCSTIHTPERVMGIRRDDYRVRTHPFGCSTNVVNCALCTARDTNCELDRSEDAPPILEGDKVEQVKAG